MTPNTYYFGPAFGLAIADALGIRHLPTRSVTPHFSGGEALTIDITVIPTVEQWAKIAEALTHPADYLPDGYDCATTLWSKEHND